jgi:hypothetical protein
MNGQQKYNCNNAAEEQEKETREIEINRRNPMPPLLSFEMGEKHVF